MMDCASGQLIFYCQNVAKRKLRSMNQVLCQHNELVPSEGVIAPASETLGSCPSLSTAFSTSYNNNWDSERFSLQLHYIIDRVILMPADHLNWRDSEYFRLKDTISDMQDWNGSI